MAIESRRSTVRTIAGTKQTDADATIYNKSEVGTNRKKLPTNVKVTKSLRNKANM